MFYTYIFCYTDSHTNLIVEQLLCVCATRAAELRAECSQEAVAHSDIVVENLTDELSTLREELSIQTSLCKR